MLKMNYLFNNITENSINKMYTEKITGKVIVLIRFVLNNMKGRKWMEV